MISVKKYIAILFIALFISDMCDMDLGDPQTDVELPPHLEEMTLENILSSRLEKLQTLFLQTSDTPKNIEEHSRQ